MYNAEEFQPLGLTAVPPHLPDLPPTERGSVDLPSVQMEQPPQRHPGELVFIVNAVETPTVPLDGVPLLLIHRSVHPSKIGSVPHNTPSLDTSFALQGSWMLIERGLQVHRRFGQTESIMVIERFPLEQLT